MTGRPAFKPNSALTHPPPGAAGDTKRMAGLGALALLAILAGGALALLTDDDTTR